MPIEVSVCYHAGTFTLPARYDPPPDRLASTPGDNLCEFAARVCYASIDRTRAGRPSAEYFKNVLGARHLSVIAHPVETFRVLCPAAPSAFAALAALQLRPGVWVTRTGTPEAPDDWYRVRFCLNLRALTEWPDQGAGPPDPWSTALRARLGALLKPVYPLALGLVPGTVPGASARLMELVDRVPPELPHERWCSLFISGISRNASLELVRHHWQANPSQESTRYVDMTGCGFAGHPTFDDKCRQIGAQLEADSRRAYANTFTYLTATGAGKKEARGAARQYLLGGAETTLVFSLSLFQARHLLALRLPASADPEIRALAAHVRAALLPLWPELGSVTA